MATLVASSLSAQATSAPPTEAVGLRVEMRRWGRGSIHDGAARVGSIRLLSSDLERVVADSDEAARHARRFGQERALGNALIVFGIAVATALFADYVQSDGPDMGGWESAAMIARGGVASYGIYRLTLSNRALGRCLEAFNRGRGR